MKIYAKGFVVLAITGSLVVSALTPAFASPPRLAQTLNPAYLSEMPAPARIIKDIKGKDAEDTIERQMGAFMALNKMIDDMAYGLERRYLPVRATKDENRYKDSYSLAYADLWHKATNKEDHLYDHDRELLGELLTKFFPQSFRDLYAKSDANANAYYQAYRAKMSGPLLTIGPTPNPGSSTSVSPGAAGAVAPGSTGEMRRCLESGRSQRNCFSEGMSNGMDQITGISLKMPVPVGLRMTGDYSGAKGVRLIFQPDKAVLTCNDVSSPMPYTVRITDTQALIEIDNGSKPVGFALRPDGKLAGAGSAKINGITANGTRTEQTMGATTQTTTTTRELTPLEAQNNPNATRNGQTYSTTENSTQTTYGPTGTRNVINYENRVGNCILGLMTPTGPTPLPPDIESPFGIITAIGSGLGTLMNGGTTQDAAKEMLSPQPISPGLRMAGKYSGPGGFSMTFHPESVTLGCGDAERALEYSVQRSGSQTVVMVKDKTDPVTLQLKPDGSLLGQGTVQVNGRTIVGQTEDPKNPFIYAPKVAKCTVGRLVTGGDSQGSGQIDAGTYGGPTLSPGTLPVNTNAASPLQNPNAKAGTGGFSISTNFDGHPLIGKPIIFFKESLEDLFRKQGFQNTPGGAGKSAIALYAEACKAKDPRCEAANQAIAAQRINVINTNAAGRVDVSNVPPGSYWVVTAIGSKGRSYLWNIRVDVAPGIQAPVSLNEGNIIIDW
jgi:hypothetical protein